jgi:hypothetical protein
MKASSIPTGSRGEVLQRTEDPNMKSSDRAKKIISDMERISPYMYEGLYGNFLRNFMDGDQSRWTHDLSQYLTRANHEWADVGSEIAGLLWERFERRISC